MNEWEDDCKTIWHWRRSILKSYYGVRWCKGMRHECICGQVCSCLKRGWELNLLHEQWSGLVVECGLSLQWMGQTSRHDSWSCAGLWRRGCSFEGQLLSLDGSLQSKQTVTPPVRYKGYVYPNKWYCVVLLSFASFILLYLWTVENHVYDKST